MMIKRFTPVFLSLFLLLTACATAPVQEMSDARQAIKAAEVAGAREYAAEAFAEALQLLDDADYLISQRRFEVARVVARRAKTISIQARRAALHVRQQQGDTTQ